MAVNAEPKKTGPWKNMTAEERSAEMRRRQAVAKRNGKAKAKKNGYVCKHCGDKFETKYKLANHVRYQHPKSRRGRSNDHASAQEGLDHHISYLFGKVETIIEYYASSNGLPKQALAEGVAGLLRH